MDQVADVLTRNVRVVPVCEGRKPLGVVSLGDLAERGSSESSVGEALKDISTSAAPDRA